MVSVRCPYCGQLSDWNKSGSKVFNQLGDKVFKKFVCPTCGCTYRYYADTYNNREWIDDPLAIHPMCGYKASKEPSESAQEWFEEEDYDFRTFDVTYGEPIYLPEENARLNTIYNLPYKQAVLLYPEAEDMKLGQSRTIELGSRIIDRTGEGFYTKPKLTIVRTSNAKPKRRFFRR